jgi:cytochrome c-type biogenesis protein
LGQGIVLLLAYSMGLAIPFLITALAVERFIHWFRKYRRLVPLAEKLAGAILVGVGVLLVSGYFSLLAGWLQGLTPEFLRSRL